MLLIVTKISFLQNRQLLPFELFHFNKKIRVFEQNYRRNFHNYRFLYFKIFSKLYILTLQKFIYYMVRIKLDDNKTKSRTCSDYYLCKSLKAVRI